MSLLEQRSEAAAVPAVETARDDLLLICVNYRKPVETARFVSSAREQTLNSALHVIVVDNSPPDGEGGVPEAVRDDPHVTTIAPGKNLGYFGGAAVALSGYLKSNALPDWVIVSNPDVYFPDHDVLHRLCDIHRGSEPAVLAPSIRTLNSGVDQNPYMRVRPDAWRIRLNSRIFSIYPVDAVYQGLSWIKHRSLDGVAKERPATTAGFATKIYAPHGSFIALHRTYFEKGGTLDYGAFLFGEEIFVAETASRLGLTVLYEPGVVIEHTERSTAKGLWNRDISRYRRQASRYLARKFF
ncbi:MAG: glycosyltransferase family 2 protein [Chloroflexi bacterium]|nr:MAG: glycosyltransferase family 2 protein [Chloroflexota bacterium]